MPSSTRKVSETNIICPLHIHTTYLHEHINTNSTRFTTIKRVAIVNKEFLQQPPKLHDIFCQQGPSMVLKDHCSLRKLLSPSSLSSPVVCCEVTCLCGRRHSQASGKKLTNQMCSDRGSHHKLVTMMRGSYPSEHFLNDNTHTPSISEVDRSYPPTHTHSVNRLNTSSFTNMCWSDTVDRDKSDKEPNFATFRLYAKTRTHKKAPTLGTATTDGRRPHCGITQQDVSKKKTPMLQTAADSGARRTFLALWLPIRSPDEFKVDDCASRSKNLDSQVQAQRG